LVTFEIKNVEIAGPLSPGKEMPAKVHGVLTIKQKPVDTAADATVMYIKLTPEQVEQQRRFGFASDNVKVKAKLSSTFTAHGMQVPQLLFLKVATRSRCWPTSCSFASSGASERVGTRLSDEHAKIRPLAVAASEATPRRADPAALVERSWPAIGLGAPLASSPTSRTQRAGRRSCRPPCARAGRLRARVTGPPGAGKSTVVDRLTALLRAEGDTVGIAPSIRQPVQRRRVLGDRTACRRTRLDPGVFIEAWPRAARSEGWRARPARSSSCWGRRPTAGC